MSVEIIDPALVDPCEHDPQCGRLIERFDGSGRYTCRRTVADELTAGRAAIEAVKQVRALMTYDDDDDCFYNTHYPDRPIDPEWDTCACGWTQQDDPREATLVEHVYGYLLAALDGAAPEPTGGG